MGEACAVQSSDGRVGRGYRETHRGRKWSADVVGVFNTCADRDGQRGRHKQNTRSHNFNAESPFFLSLSVSVMKLVYEHTDVYAGEGCTDSQSCFDCVSSLTAMESLHSARHTNQCSGLRLSLPSLMSTGVTENVHDTNFSKLRFVAVGFFFFFLLGGVKMLSNTVFFFSLFLQNKASREANGLQLARVNDREPRICLTNITDK